MTGVIQSQPVDASYDEILRELAFERIIERGLEDSCNGCVISNEDMDHRIRSWRKQGGLRKLPLESDPIDFCMSGDYELAIEEGATVVRVGQAIFGKRPLPDSHLLAGVGVMVDKVL